MKYLRNTTTGEIHRVTDDGASLEQENLDAAREAGHLRQIPRLIAVAMLKVYPNRRCSHCWKEGE